MYFHVWFATKRRKWLLQGDVLDAVRVLIPEIALDKGIKLLEFEAIVDHVHLLLDLEDKGALPNAIMNLKGVSAWRIFQRFPELKLDADTSSFWQAGYGSKLVTPGTEEQTRHYIRTQWERLEKYERGVPRGSARGMS